MFLPVTHSLPLHVDQAMGEVDVASMWNDLFKSTLNFVADKNSEQMVRSQLRYATLEIFFLCRPQWNKGNIAGSLPVRCWGSMVSPLVHSVMCLVV